MLENENEKTWFRVLQIPCINDIATIQLKNPRHPILFSTLLLLAYYWKYQIVTTTHLTIYYTDQVSIVKKTETGHCVKKTLYEETSDKT